MKPSVISWMLCALIAVSGGGPCAAGETEVGAADARAVRAVIEAQLSALAAGDAQRAFSYASPSIQSQFGDAGSFIGMVRQGYAMLIRPLETLFLRPEAVEQGVMQPVHVRDRDGRAWLAVYHVQRQPDASWRINGCLVTPDDDDHRPA